MNYYKDTPPLEFIGDVYDIMKDGDCLSPEKLNADVVDMLGKYLSAQQNMHLTSGSLRDLWASFWLRASSALKHFTSPPAGR